MKPFDYGQKKHPGSDADRGGCSPIDVVFATRRYVIEIDSGLTLDAYLEIERVLRESGAAYRIKPTN